MNRVVARVSDGRTIKGLTNDFAPDKVRFHIVVNESAPDSKTVELVVADLKALFFVKDFAGDPKHNERKEFDQLRLPLGRKIHVIFNDGEELIGTTQGYQRGRPGFFLAPADSESNIERCYVVAAAARSIAFI